MSTRPPPDSPDQMDRKGDRRVASRRALEVLIEFSVGSDVLMHATTNLSARGAFFKHAIPYGEGTRARLRINLPGEPAIECEGEVVNIPNRKDFGMGVKFLDLREADEARIAAFAETHGPPAPDRRK